MVVQDVLRDTADHDIGHAVAHFFNCFFGDGQRASGKGVATSKKQTKRNSRSKVGSGDTSNKQASCMSLSSESLWSDILEFAKVKYQVTETFSVLD